MNTNEDEPVAPFGVCRKRSLNGDAQRRLENQLIGGLIRTKMTKDRTFSTKILDSGLLLFSLSPSPRFGPTGETHCPTFVAASTRWVIRTTIHVNYYPCELAQAAQIFWRP
ncbi:MAG: hypothetical protein HYY24_03205 [Verrucomicrobia bacterium]|nr:hypothetical protein [Verrucomicrobiota bacterium]